MAAPSLNFIPLINGEAYAWASIRTTILGRPVAGITAIEYGEKEAMKDNHGGGQFVTSRGYGEINATAKVTLEMKEVEGIQLSIGSGRLQDIPPFDIIVAYKSVGGLNPVIIHRLRNCQFTNNDRKVKQGDLGIEVELELIISHIDWK